MILFSFLLLASLFSCKNAEKEPSRQQIVDSEPEIPLTSEDVRSVLERENSNLFQGSLVKGFYAGRDHSPAWEDPEHRADLYEQLKTAEKEGLFFSDYHGERLESLISKKDPNQVDHATREILLTDAFLRYSSHLYYGKTDPGELHNIWGVRREQRDLIKVLESTLATYNIAEVFEDLKPRQAIYRGLKRALSEQRELIKQDRNDFIRIGEGELVRAGENDERMELIADRLKQLGFLYQDHEVQGGTYDPEIVTAVTSFQEEKGLATDGIIGNSTVQELNMGQEQRYQQILVNLERWRWYPRDLGAHHILINIPQYRLAVVKEGDTVREHNVVAGSRGRQTPIFSDTLAYIVLNPTWTLPPTIKTRDVLPKAANDPSYLSRNNMVVSKNGQVMDPDSIDWSDPEVGGYTFTQQPGSTNPLGRVKIIYPNRYLIYLHDTPAQSLFSRNERAASSGCVRVEDAVDLSAYVIGDQPDWDLEKIKKRISEGETIHIRITEPIQVHHFYWTAWRDNGKTIFTEDVYDLDQDTYQALSPD